MVHIKQGLLILVAAVAPLLLGAPSQGPIYFPDDPIQKLPPPVPVVKPFVHKLDQPYDFVRNSVRWQPREAVAAGGVNTVGNPPDSAWFTNRHGVHRLSREQLQRGPQQAGPPIPPFTIVGGKTEGITPGFRMKDAKGRIYFVKVDPRDHPEMATSADVIVSRFLYAIGYNVPENYIVYAKSSDLLLADDAELSDQSGQRRKMTARDLREIVNAIPHYPHGSFRMMASLKVEGDSVGPFYYQGVRSDDPNDTVPHENRRDLRALFVFFAWLNNTDARAGNTYDAVVQENGVAFIKHYLIDFGSALGSDGDAPKDARLGHEFMIATPGEALRSIFSLGMWPHPWERIHYPTLPAAGNFTSSEFRPNEWKSDYPNPAFLSRLSDDDFWAAKQVMAFTDEDIRAIVETADFRDSHVTDYMTAALIDRRNKIGKAFLPRVLPLDNFRVEDAELRFDDLAVRYGCWPSRKYAIHWFRFDNMTGERTPTAENTSARLPVELQNAAVGSYFSAVIESPESALNRMILTLSKTASGYKIVGCSRYEIPPSSELKH